MNRLFLTAYDNSIDAFIPEQWANESIALLMENMVAASLVHRDFEPVFANYGDIVNTRQPANFQAVRKGVNQSVTIQNASATNVAVPLNQHIHVSFLIRDGEETKSFKSLVDEYLRPAAIAMARDIDRVVLGQYVHFLDNHAGTLGGLTNANAVDYITATREVLNRNLAHMDGRNLVLTATAETKVLQNATFHQADRLGDDGTALREASLGRKFGFATWMDQNMASIATITPDATGLVNNAAGYAAGSTVITVDAFALGELVVADQGRWATINGRPYHITVVNADPATQITISSPGLSEAILDNAVVNVYGRGAINFGAGYAAGTDSALVVDGFAANEVKVGQLITFGTSEVRYTVKYTNGNTSIELDRPLEAALVDDATVNLGPPGDYNLSLHRNALTLAIRPLALPRAGAGAISGLANFNDLTMRTVITYDGEKQGHLVTLDFLAGVKVLDTDLGAIMLS